MSAIELLPIAVTMAVLAYVVAVAYERWKQRTCARLARWYLRRIGVEPALCATPAANTESDR